MLKFNEYLTEGKLKAEDYEAAIVIGWHNINDQTFALGRSGISEKTYTLLGNEPKVIEVGENIATSIRSHFNNGKDRAEQYGRAKSGLTKFWKSYGATDTTPKTDILIGDKRLSLKMGDAQLMSGGKAESLATFYAAMEKSKLNEDGQVQVVLSIFENFVERGLAPSQLRPLIKSGTNELVNKGEAAHKQCMQELGKLFNENEKFKIEFAREAMSGFMKYGEGSNAAAEYMLVSNFSGNDVSIKSVYDDTYCSKIADKMKLQSRFKTSSRKLKGVKTGEYKFWSVVSLIVNAVDDVQVKEEVLNENIFMRAFSQIKRKISGAIDKTKNFMKKKVKNILTFFDAIPSISIRTRIKF